MRVGQISPAFRDKVGVAFSCVDVDSTLVRFIPRQISPALREKVGVAFSCVSVILSLASGGK